jgi:hypothetical protein
MPWPLVAGSYHDPVSPCWSRSGADPESGGDVVSVAVVPAKFFGIAGTGWPRRSIAVAPSFGSGGSEIWSTPLA